MCVPRRYFKKKNGHTACTSRCVIKPKSSISIPYSILITLPPEYTTRATGYRATVSATRGGELRRRRCEREKKNFHDEGK